MGMIYRLSTYVVVNSKAVRALLVRRHGLREDKVRVIYNGLDVEQFSGVHMKRTRLLPWVSGDARLIAVLANMYSPVKGHAHLISAACEVCGRGRGALVLMIRHEAKHP